MSKLKQLSSGLFALVIFGVSGIALAASGSTIQSYRSSRANAMIEKGDSAKATNPDRALGNYRIAALLDQSSSAGEKAADLYLAQDRPDEAVTALRTAQPSNYLRIAQIQFSSQQYRQSLTTLERIQPNTDTISLKLKNLLELNQIESAMAEAGREVAKHASINLYLGLAQLMAGQTDKAALAISSLGTLEAAETLRRASTHNVSLAKVLYAQGLLRSSERILQTQLDTSESYLLLAKIKLASNQPSAAQLNEAKTALEKGRAMDPGNLGIHQLLKTVYEQIGDSANADKETELIKQLNNKK